MEAVKYFYRQIQDGHLHHAYILVGGNQKEQDKVLVEIVRALACKQVDLEAELPHSCTLCRRIEQETFADFIRIEAQGQQIKVEQIRELKKWLSESPVESEFKLVYIQEADRMNQAASNALLKVLEEPPIGVYFILGTNELASLMLTIRSRSQVYYLAAGDRMNENKSSGLKQLSSLNQVHFECLPLLTQSYLLDLSDEELGEWFDLVQRFYQALYQKKLRLFVQIQVQFASLMESKQFDATLDYLSWINYQVIRYNRRKGQETDPFLNKMTAAKSQDEMYLFKLQTEILEARRYLKANVASQLVAERLVLSLMTC